MYYIAVKGTVGWLADFLVGEIDLSNTTFLKFCHSLVGNREICVARSLLKSYVFGKGS